MAYTTTAHVRTAEEVATNLVFPEESTFTPLPTDATVVMRYIASVERPKKEVMTEIKEEIKDHRFDDTPLICVMDGAKCLWTYAEDIFKTIKTSC